MNCVPVYSRADPGHPVPRLGRETATRALSYVAMTRGRDTNTAYLSQRTTEQEDRQAWPEAMSQLGANWRSRPQTARDDRELPDSLQHNAIHPMSDRGSGGRSSNPVSPTQVRGCFWPPNPPPRWLWPKPIDPNPLAAAAEIRLRVHGSHSSERQSARTRLLRVMRPICQRASERPRCLAVPLFGEARIAAAVADSRRT